MFHTQSDVGHFLDPNENLESPLRKAFDLSTILPEIKNYQATQTRENKNWTKDEKMEDDFHPNRSKSGQSLIKNKSKKEKTSVFLQIATKNRPDILHVYLSYNEILQYLDYINIRFSNFTKILTIGRTFEKRPIKCIEINWNNMHNIWSQAKENRIRSAPIHQLEPKQSNNSDTSKIERNIVFIEGGTHAREWLSVTVALNCIYQLTEKNARHRDILRNLIFYIVPVVNPDGYEYTRNVNPRWRKNRRPHIDGDNIGTDCNRNFDFHWDECCAKAKRNTYQGEKPFSEPETQALAAILHKLAPKLLFFLSLHSYAQSIMYPWGYAKVLPKNVKFMESVAIAGRNVIKAFTGRYYRVGSIANVTKRNIAGSVIDYAHGVVKIPLTLVMELPSSEYGFQPPAEQIYPLGMESWQGIREMCRKAFSLKDQIEQEEAAEQHNENIDNKTNLNSSEPTLTPNVESNEKISKNPLRPNKLIKNKKLKSKKQELTEGIIKSIFDAKV